MSHSTKVELLINLRSFSEDDIRNYASIVNADPLNKVEINLTASIDELLDDLQSVTKAILDYAYQRWEPLGESTEEEERVIPDITDIGRIRDDLEVRFGDE